jgi:hypothetical protein
MPLDFSKIHKKEDGSLESINSVGSRIQLDESIFPVRVKGSVMHALKRGVYGSGDPVEHEYQPDCPAAPTDGEYNEGEDL